MIRRRLRDIIQIHASCLFWKYERISQFRGAHCLHAQRQQPSRAARGLHSKNGMVTHKTSHWHFPLPLFSPFFARSFFASKHVFILRSLHILSNHSLEGWLTAPALQTPSPAATWDPSCPFSCVLTCSCKPSL
jgi:hypothetical protein